MARFLNIDLYNFRSWKTFSAEPSHGVNLITGANGSGKTNIIEACFYAVMAKSFRHARLKEMINNGASEFSIRIKAESHSITHDIKVSGTVTDHSFELDSHRIKSVTDLVGRFPVMVFSPDDLLMVSGGPVERRRFVNMILSQCSQTYFHLLISYNRTLAQRNAVLKSESPDKELLSVLTGVLIRDGALIRKERRKFIKELSRYSAHYMSLISGETLEISYRPDLEDENGDTLLIRKEALSCAAREIIEQRTLFGPHKDELEIVLLEKDARKYASRGQVRSIVLAMKMGGVDLIEKWSNEKCVLLLDDLFSELDDSRSAELMNLVNGNRQAIMTLPKKPDWLDLSDVTCFNTSR
jgi:DNA replication and repair protein RecF